MEETGVRSSPLRLLVLMVAGVYSVVAGVLAVAVLVPLSVFASDSSSIVVAIGYTPSAPSVRIQTRADFLAVPITIQSDAKDPMKRIDHIESALRAVSDRVRQHTDLAMKPGVVSLSPREGSKSFSSSFSSYEAPSSSAQLYVLAALKPETTVFALTKKIYQVVTPVAAPDGAKVVIGNTTLGMSDPERFRPLRVPESLTGPVPEILAGHPGL
jgi:hypothetical protein